MTGLLILDYSAAFDIIDHDNFVEIYFFIASFFRFFVFWYIYIRSLGQMRPRHEFGISCEDCMAGKLTFLAWLYKFSIIIFLITINIIINISVTDVYFQSSRSLWALHCCNKFKRNIQFRLQKAFNPTFHTNSTDISTGEAIQRLKCTILPRFDEFSLKQTICEHAVTCRRCWMLCVTTHYMKGRELARFPLPTPNRFLCRRGMNAPELFQVGSEINKVDNFIWFWKTNKQRCITPSVISKEHNYVLLCQKLNKFS